MQSFIEIDKTLLTFNDKSGDKSTLTFDKAVADALQKIVPDPHAWVQKQYDGIIAGEERYAKYINAFKSKNGELTRLEIGNIIRFIAGDITTDNLDL